MNQRTSTITFFALAFLFLLWMVLLTRADPAIRIVDGDTIVYGNTKIRAVGYDTPEIHHYQCSLERLKGEQAANRLGELITSPHHLTVKYEKGHDKYGRALARVYSDGRDVGPILIAEGLARAYDGKHKRPSWCE